MAEGIFSNSKCIIDEVLNRMIECMKIATLYVYDVSEPEMDRLSDIVSITKLTELDNCLEGLLYVECPDGEAFASVWPWMKKNRSRTDIICYIKNGEAVAAIPVQYYDLHDFSDSEGKVLLIGRTFDEQCVLTHKASDFKVLAIIHTYNEADILEKTVQYLLSQEVDVYIVDNWSDDGTYEIAHGMEKKFTGRIYVERFPESGKTEFYEWYHQLKRTEDISKIMSYDWFIHYDADEMRISPWKNVTLRQAISYIDSQGYNLIENTVIDFKLTEDYADNIFMRDTYFDFGHRTSHFSQIKSWKKTDFIEIKESGGHIATVPEPRVYPLKILNRHYPFRSLAQAKRKVFRDRKPRFVKERAERGWHGHYDKILEEGEFLTDKAGLLKWDETTFQKYYLPLFLGCGIAIEGGGELQTVRIRNKKIVIFGAGKVGKWLYHEYSKKNKVVGWVDNCYDKIQSVYGKVIQAPDRIPGWEFDYVVIAVKRKENRKEITEQLVDLGVEKDKIYCLD